MPKIRRWVPPPAVGTIVALPTNTNLVTVAAKLNELIATVNVLIDRHNSHNCADWDTEGVPGVED